MIETALFMTTNSIEGHTLVSSAASVAMFKGAVRPKLVLGAKAAAEPTVARNATVENFIFNFFFVVVVVVL